MYSVCCVCYVWFHNESLLYVGVYMCMRICEAGLSKTMHSLHNPYFMPINPRKLAVYCGVWFHTPPLHDHTPALPPIRAAGIPCRVPSDPFYTAPAWRQCRSEFLRTHRECSVNGCGRRASHVDHVVSRRRGGAPYDPANLSALCHSHHTAKTNAVDGGFGNRPGEFRPIVKGCDASGRPLDPAHPWRR